MRFTTDEARHAGLMEWIADQSPGLVELDPFYADVEQRLPLMIGDVKGLESRGLVDGYVAGGGHAAASLTDKGRSYVEDLRLKRSSDTARRKACRTAVLQWLDSVGAVSESKSSDWGVFERDGRNDFYGQPFTKDDVETAAAWLWQQRFIDGVKVGEWDGPVVPYLTPRGVDCIEVADGDTRRYIDGTRAAGGSFFSSQYMQVSTGDNSKQTMNVGMDRDHVQNLLHGLLTVAAAFASGEDQAGLAELVRDAEEDLRSDSPTSEGARRFGDRVRSLARASGQAGLVAVIDASVRELFGLLGHLPH